MNLNKEDIALFFKLWFALIYSINCKHKIVPPFERPIYGNDVEKTPFLVIRKELWKKPEFIDEFLAGDGATLPDDEKAILISWRTNFISDNFFVLKYLKKYTVFMSSGNPAKLYGVWGISDSIEVVLQQSVLPRMVETALLPFKGKIIYDSLVVVRKVSFGTEIERDFAKRYKQIKAESGIIESM